MSNEYLFIQDIQLLTPEDYQYGRNRIEDFQLARNAFYDHDICVHKLDVDTFEVYRDDANDKLVIAFLAGVGIHGSNRSRFIRENICLIAEIFSKSYKYHDLAYIITCTVNHLVTRGATSIGKIMEKESDHLSIVLREEALIYNGRQSYHCAEDFNHYGKVLEISQW